MLRSTYTFNTTVGGSVQTLTRVSISRNSRREMTHSFPSQAGEVDFHISFSSRVSRFWEQKFSFSSPFSRSFIKILFLLSILKILKTDFSFSSQFVKYWYWESLSLLDFQDYFLFFSYQYTKSLGALPSPNFRWQTFGLSIYEILFPVPHLMKHYLFGGLRCHYPTFVWHPTSSTLGKGSKRK